MTLKSDLPASACARCGAPFTCGMVAGTPQCWCNALPPLPTLLPFETCLCPACLEQALKDIPDAGPSHPAGRHP
ncbi:MAG TPA: cysteine-rich CWC family protein [Burkholderiales bacterium]|nr:cysteine-rich CWC family protein [Burkholderiales bacterium]